MQQKTCISSLFSRQEQKWCPDTSSQHPLALEKINQIEAVKGTLVDTGVEQESFDLPTFTQHINDIVCDEESQARFECSLEPKEDPNLHVEWQLNGKPMMIGSRIQSSLDFGLVYLNIDSVQANDAGVITCTATNKAGQATTSGSLKVNLAGNVISTTQHPAKQAGLDNINKFETSATGKLGDDVDCEPMQKFEKPIFTTQLPEKVESGPVLTLNCNVEPKNDPNLKVTWYHNGLPLTSATRISVKHDFGLVELQIKDMIAPKDAGIYTCKAVNDAGEAVVFTTVECQDSDQIDLETKHPKGKEGLQAISDFESKLQLPDEEEDREPNGEAPRFVQEFKSINVTDGDKGYFEAQLEPKNDPKINIEWCLNGQPLQESSRYKKVHSFGMVILDIGNVCSTDAGTYSCKAFNQFGEATSTAKLNFTEEKSSHCPKFVGSLDDQLNLTEGQSVHLQCALEPVNDTDLKVEWFFNDQALPNSSRLKTVADFGFVMLDIAGVDSRDSGKYTCRAWNKYAL